MARRAPAFIPPAEGEMLLHLARKVLQNALLKEKAPVMPAFAPNLQQPYGCQITLWQNGKVLAQSTTMAGDKPLLTNVVISTARFAVEDSVAKLTPEMLQGIRIEIGVISIPQEVHFRTLDELHGALRPGKHGLLVRLNGKEAGFIPAVWKQVPQPDRFVAALCRRLGQSPDALLGNDVRVRVFEMVTFREP